MKLDLVFPSATAPPPPPPPASSVGSADDRSTTFRPVTGGEELQSGEKLLVEAYAAIWVILFAVVLMSWRKQRAVDARLDGLEASIAKAVAMGNPQTPPGSTDVAAKGSESV